LSNSGAAVRLFGEGRATGPPKSVSRGDTLREKSAIACRFPRDAGGGFGIGLQFSGDGHTRGKDDPRALWRTISPGFFTALGVPVLEGRDFNALDDQSHEPVAIVSATLAQRMFPGQVPINRHVYWTDPVLEFLPGSEADKSRFKSPHRIIGVAADVDDEHIVPAPNNTIYGTFADSPMFGGHLFIHTTGNPYSLVTPVTKLIRDMSADQPVEHPATLEDIRAKVLAPDRLNSLVFGVFAAVALLIAVVGVAGVLASSVSARTREFGIRLALGSQPEKSPQKCGHGRRGDGWGRRSGGRGVRTGRYARGRRLFRRAKNAGRMARDRFCVCAVRRGGNRFDAPGGTRRPRRRNASPALGMIFSGGRLP
jgi:hypothetical protein